jgi:hypothetical protein
MNPCDRAQYSLAYGSPCYGEGTFILARGSKYSTRAAAYYFFETEQDRADFITANPEMSLTIAGNSPA